jgi:hypothetical protein
MKKEVKRRILMVTGILAVAIIVLTQSFYKPTQVTQKKSTNTEQSGKTDNVVVSAPSDLSNSGNAQVVNDHSPAVIDQIKPNTAAKKATVVVKKTAIRFFQTLFRVFISPNAP